MTRTTKILIGIAAVVAVGVIFAGWQGMRSWIAWNSIDRVEFDLSDARSVLPESVADSSDESGPTPTITGIEYDTVLVIGSDDKPDEFQIGEYADAVMMYLMPDDGTGPLIVSLPRDLVVTNPCTGEEAKLDRTLEGCGDDISGEELVALAVEDFTGVAVDNFASFRFEAFVALVDAVGGVEVCVPNALREGETDIMPAGCSTLDGDQALLWIRSRRTQEFVDGDWQFIDDNGDAARVRRQQVLVFALVDEMRAIRSPAELTGVAEGLGDTVILDDTLGLAEAVSMAWDLRSVVGAGLRTFIVPTESATLPDGSFAVRATKSFAEVIGR